MLALDLPTPREGKNLEGLPFARKPATTGSDLIDHDAIRYPNDNIPSPSGTLLSDKLRVVVPGRWSDAQLDYVESPEGMAMTENRCPQKLLHTVFDPIEAIFFHVPKCGGGTVLRTLESRLDRPNSFNKKIKKDLRKGLSDYLEPRIGAKRAQRFARGHVTYEIQELIVPPEILERYFKFAFVRGPYDRLFSAWNDLTRSHSTMLDRLKHPELRDFNVFVKTRLRENIFVDGEINEAWLDRDSIYIHFYPQHLFVCKDGEIQADFLGRLESFAEDFDKLAVRLELGDVSMVTKHVKFRGNLKTTSRYIDRYDDEAIAIVNELYGEDFEHLGYERQ